MPSMSREISAWVETLTFEDLPPNVVDRAKGVTLQALSSALLGHEFAEARQAVAMMQEEEAGGGGAATCLVTGTKLTKAGAALVNAETIFAGGKWDTFRMLTHPGCAIIPAALAAAEVSGANGKTFLTGVAAGYEIMERLASDFIPTVMSRGFHSGPVFGIFGAAIAYAKIVGLDANLIHGAIAQMREFGERKFGRYPKWRARAPRRGRRPKCPPRSGYVETRRTWRRDHSRRRSRLLPRLYRQ